MECIFKKKKTWNWIGLMLGVGTMVLGIFFAVKKVELYYTCFFIISGILVMIHFGKETFCVDDAQMTEELPEL